MAITERTAVETQVTPAATNITVTKPTGLADGDFVVISLALNGGSLSAAPTGFTLIFSQITQANPRQYVYGKYITSAAGEGAWTFTATSVTKTAIAQAYIGVDATQSLDVAAQTASNSTGSNVMTVPSVTTVTPGAWLIYAGALNSSSATLTPPTGMTETLETAGIKKQSLNRETIAAAGATGTRAAVASSATLAWAAGMFALRPAGASAGGTVPARSRQSRMTQIRM